MSNKLQAWTDRKDQSIDKEYPIEMFFFIFYE